ncbi:hypothetical protein B0H63DRAFT_529680 [Podospora didyma]|uniref:Cupin type-1 domain-containing protein n=1 Tax=Podospora didyma TaxID=330526 RepID=A0AAE0N217_9PEZI|nr:hypothetical protein B0H63DRAFT_529680 [Podospora didyma]
MPSLKLVGSHHHNGDAKNDAPTAVHSSLSGTPGSEDDCTLSHAELQQGAVPWPHFHANLTKTFTLLSGSPITAFAAENANTRNPSDLAPHALSTPGDSFTVLAGTLHRFATEGESSSAAVRLDPGAPGFEHMLAIIQGLAAEDDEKESVMAPMIREANNGAGMDAETTQMLFKAVYAVLGDINHVGDGAKKLAGALKKRGELVEKLQEALGAAVCNG